MIQRLIIFILTITATALSAYPQFKLEFQAFEEENNIEARRNPVLDFNGEPTALLIIQIPVLTDATVATSNKIGEVEYTPSELRVHLTDGTKKIIVKHNDFEPFTYEFNPPLKGRNVYRLVLSVPEDYLSLGQVAVRISTNVLDATLAIDGEQYTTSNGVFLLKMQPGEYPYTLTTPKSGFIPSKGTLTITDREAKETGRKDEYIAIHSDKKSNLHIAAADQSTIKIDGQTIDKKSKVVSLPLGRHYVAVSQGGYTRTFTVDLINENENLDADIRVPLTIVSPTKAEYTIKPIGNSMKPSLSKFKANQPIRLMGEYSITAKAKGYEPLTFTVKATPEMSELRMAIPLISEANKLSIGTPDTRQNVEKALKTYRKMIASGDEVAMWEYGRIMLNSGDVNQGHRNIRKAADLGHPQAALFVAEKIIENNPSEKLKYLNIALMGGEKAAYQDMGDIHSLYSPVDLRQAYEDYSKYNSSYSKVRRADIVLNNPDLIKVPHSEIYEMLESIGKDDPMYSYALNGLGSMSFFGLGVAKDTAKAIDIWNKADPTVLSQKVLLIMAVNNLEKDDLMKYISHLKINEITEDGIIANGVTAIQLLTRAGQRLDKDKPLMAFTLLDKAYKLGDRSLTTVSYLGKYYKEGTATLKNASKAKELLRMAVDNYNDVRSMRWLGNIYETENNFDAAENMYLKAIALNDPIAKGYYATLIFNKGKSNYPKAVSLWTEAANAGHKQSMKNLIRYYEKVARDPSKAAYWKKKL